MFPVRTPTTTSPVPAGVSAVHVTVCQVETVERLNTREVNVPLDANGVTRSQSNVIVALPPTPSLIAGRIGPGSETVWVATNPPSM